MRRLAKIGTAMATVGVVLLVVGLLNGGAKAVAFENWQPKVVTRSTEKYDVDEFESVKVNVNYLNVEIVRGDKYDVRYVANKAIGLDVDVVDGVLEISQQHFDGNFGFGIGFIGDDMEQKLQITIPEDVDLKNIEVAGNSGDIKVSDMKLEKLNLKTNSGDVNVAGTKVSEGTTIRSNSGEVDVHDSDLRSPSITVANGNVSLFDSKLSNINVELRNGDFRADTNEFTGDNIVRNTNGDNAISGADRKLGYRITTRNGDNTLFDKRSERGTLSQNWNNKNRIEMTTNNSENDVQ